ncbi:hypothetical protein BJF78_31940 [Pseudonocardia sp. CNS-139]|nr:hypothetical protein BJF78_31940 [Pseudonocardia sp. CNS-139]
MIARAVRDACRELDRIDDPLIAEMYVSETLGVWWGLHVVDADPEVIFGEALVAKAATTRKPAALGLLRCVAVLGTERQRRAAAEAADALAAGGVAEPAWAGAVGTGRVRAAWAYGDVYGDQTSVLLAVERSGVEHGVVVLVDHTLGGIAKDAFATPDPSGVLGDLRGFAGPLVQVRELSVGEAAAMLYPAFAASDAGPEPPVSEDFAANRALALSRVRMLGPSPAAAPGPVVGRAERQMIVNGFLAAPAGRDLPAQRAGAPSCSSSSARRRTAAGRCG